MLEKIDGSYRQIQTLWRKSNPDIYSGSDAGYILKSIKDKQYVLGEDKIDPDSIEGKAKLWSLPPDVLTEIQGIVKESGHVHYLPFILGTYNMDSRTMRMNDVSLTDPSMIYLMTTGGIEGFSTPFLRGLYYVGRRSWWRHESIHARHHHQMSHFLSTRDENKWDDNSWQSSYRLQEAAYTIHESGIEELLTRWQTLKEARGMKEKGVSALSLLFYLEYASFTGIRNMFIDGKEKTLDLVHDGKIRVPAKLAVSLGMLFGPGYLNGQTQYVDNSAETISQLLPLTAGQISGVMIRAQAYVAVAAIGAMFSSKEKGAFEKKKLETEERMPTTEYKFPYAYSPVAALGRSIDFLQYLQRVWDEIPNYRLLESTRKLDLLKREINDRVTAKTNSKQHQFTMKVIEDALYPIEQTAKSGFPYDAYVKGMFTPALYLRLKELYT